MSLVPTYVKMGDGLWYKDPVLQDGNNWFICFDDDDPPELVISNVYGKSPRQVLKEAGIKATKITFKGESGRLFESDKFIDAKSYFLKIIVAPPITHLDKQEQGKEEMPSKQGVFYKWREIEP